MLRSFGVITAVCLALTPMAQALAQAATTPPDVQAQFQQAALKSCNDALDRGNFTRWGTIEDCVADKTLKMERAYHANPASPQAAIATQARQPN
jgi:FAD/FMN-containing dehydrogenase